MPRWRVFLVWPWIRIAIRNVMSMIRIRKLED